MAPRLQLHCLELSDELPRLWPPDPCWLQYSCGFSGPSRAGRAVAASQDNIEESAGPDARYLVSVPCLGSIGLIVSQVPPVHGRPLSERCRSSVQGLTYPRHLAGLEVLIPVGSASV